MSRYISPAVIIMLALICLYSSGCSIDRPTPGKLKGTVTWDGSPVSNIVVRFGEKDSRIKTRTDRNGQFMFDIEDFSPGTYGILAEGTVGIKECTELKLFELDDSEVNQGLILDLELKCF